MLHPVEIDQGFALGGMEVRPFAISHDANEPSGFRIENGKKAVAVATDLGMYDGYTVENLKGLNGVVLEANHDIHMLEVGPYPYPLKRRVMGDKGHLSNEWSGRLLCDILHDGLQYVVLGHLSKENNYAELAYETVTTIKYGADKIAIEIKEDETLANTINIIKKKINPA